MNDILITGINGFIGGYIFKRLSDCFNVIGCGRSNNLNNSCIDYFKWDLSYDEPDTLRKRDFDTIIHTAADVNTNAFSREMITTNCLGAYSVLQAAVHHRVKTVVFLSSLPIVGKTHPIPITETVGINPPTLYHATKAAGELIINQGQYYGVRIVNLRVPSPIGPEMPDKTIVPVFIRNALNNEDIIMQGKGSRKQNYLDVRDLAEVVFQSICNDSVDGVYNVGSKNIISNIELARLCISVIGSRSKISFSGVADPDDDVDWTTDDSKLRSVIGDYQSYKMDASIKDIANEMLK